MQHTILSIEDLSSFRQLMRIALECEGFDVQEARSGAQGLEMAHSVHPDLILLDTAVNGVDGVQGETVCQTLLADPDLRDIPIVMLSSSQDEAAIESALSAGAKGYLVRPFYPKELVALAQRLIQR
jgi:two-component system alkaline phosphatase synthesis response regulator PhoP